MDYRDLIVSNLRDLYKMNEHTSKFKAIAYKKALNALPAGPIRGEQDLAAMAKGSIYTKIKTIIDTNTDLPDVIEYRNDDSYDAIDKLQGVHGIGPTKAKELYFTHNIKSVSDMIAKQNELKLNKVQTTGLRYYNDITQRIPYNEMCMHDRFIEEHISDMCQFKVVGSYRRKAPNSGDIDILITGPNNNLHQVIDRLMQSGYVAKDGVLAKGKVKFMGICKLNNCSVHRRIDILYTPENEHPFAVLYFTGNDKFNINMRSFVSKQKLTLNEQGLYTTDKQHVPHSFVTEHDIFEYLKIPYVEPEHRNDSVVF